ncbi:hypothetical protein FRC12_022831 [Ceratobasidium sp. 428]|nr:hypothetical protein FRC12_022831 [Ceratobasidium sp. 428]
MYTRIIYLSAFASLAAAHGVITAVKGANGVTGIPMGVDTSTPRDGTRAKPFQQDTSIIRDREIQSGKVGACGRTNLNAASSAGLPSATESGEIQMTLHQVNQDGAGPYTCDVSADGGNTFQKATVTKNVPGAFLGLSTATAEDFPLNVQMPAGMQCAGGPNGDACVVRCRNATPAGPFGSCAVVTNAQAGGAAGGVAGGAAGGAAAPATQQKAATGAGATKPAAPAPAADDNQGQGGAGGALAGLKKLLGGRSAYLNRLPSRALAGPEEFADSDAKDAELEAKLIADLESGKIPKAGKRAFPGPEAFAETDAQDAALEEKLIAELENGQTPKVEKKRVLRSRVVGSLSGYWI